MFGVAIATIRRDSVEVFEEERRSRTVEHEK